MLSITATLTATTDRPPTPKGLSNKAIHHGQITIRTPGAAGCEAVAPRRAGVVCCRGSCVGFLADVLARKPPVSYTHLDVYKRQVQDSMEKQMRAERDKRAAVLTAEGVKQSAILTAQGEKEAQILRAEGSAQARVLEAQGQACLLYTSRCV